MSEDYWKGKNKKILAHEWAVRDERARDKGEYEEQRRILNSCSCCGNHLGQSFVQVGKTRIKELSIMVCARCDGSAFDLAQR